MKTSLLRIVLAAVSLIALSFIAFACADEEEDASQLATATSTPGASPTATVPLTPSAGATATPESATAFPTATATRATFTNTKYGFAFDYPGDWLIDPHNRRDETTSDYVDLWNYRPPDTPQTDFPPSPGAFDDKIRVEFYVEQNADNLSLEDWVAKFNSNPTAPNTLVTSESAEINGINAIRQTVVSVAGGSPGHLAFFELGQSVLFVNGPNVDSRFVSIYEQVVSSLRRA